MPLFLIERNFAEQVEMKRDDALQISQVNADVGVQWLFSFLSADKEKSYCLYEAPSAEAICEAAQRLSVPADVVIEVGNCGRRCSHKQQRRTGRASLAAATSSSSLYAPVGGVLPPSN